MSHTPLARRSRVLRLATPLVVGVLALTGCSSVEGTGGKGYVSGNGAITEVAVDDREKVIEYTGDDLDGNEMTLEQFQGKPTVVNVWGSWCPPCRKEQPDLNEAAVELGDAAHFVGINIRDSDPAQALAYVRNFEVEYPSFHSPDGKALLPFSGKVPPKAIPSTVILDAEGRVAATIIGMLPSTQTLVDVVETVADSHG